MSFMDDMSEVPLSITGEMWMCADSTGPSRVGAGRGLKNFITIEKDRFCVYSSRSAQSKQLKEVAFRSMKLVAWFAHHPKPPGGGPPTASTTAATLRRRVAKDRLAATHHHHYYYLVLEFLRDNTIPGTVLLGKRERIVLCTDDPQDFSIWRKFVDLYESPLLHQEFVEGRDRNAMKARARAGGAPDHDDTTSSDDDGDEGRDLGGGGAVGPRLLDLWKNRCVALLNDFAHLSNPSLQVKSADVFELPAGHGGLDWDTHAEAVLYAIEHDMRPSMKVVPSKSIESDTAGTSSLLSSPPIFPTNGSTGAPTPESMRLHLDTIQSQVSNLRVELEQFQVVTAEVGAFVEGRELQATKMSPDTLQAYLETLRKAPTLTGPAGGIATQRRDETPAETNGAAADLAELESACAAAVHCFTENNRTNDRLIAETSNREKAKWLDREALPQRVETVVAILVDELTRASADVAALAATASRSTAPMVPSLESSVSLELNELRRLLNRKEMEVETLQQQQFDLSRHTKQLSRRFEEAVLLYSDAAHDMVRSHYREYASLRNLFLSALRGEVPLDNLPAAEVSVTTSGGSFGGASETHRANPSHLSESAMRGLVVSAAHLEAVQALEQERSAARERQRALEDVMTELEVLRQQRDEEIANLKCNFLAAEEAWERDMTALQAKLSSWQSAMPQGTLLVPVSSVAVNTPAKAAIAQTTKAVQLQTTATPLDLLELPKTQRQEVAESHHELREMATLLALAPSESSLGVRVACQRLQAFYHWAVETALPLTTASASDRTPLEIVTSVVHAYQALLEHTSVEYSALRSGKKGSPEELLNLIGTPHHNFQKLWGILENHLLIHYANGTSEHRLRLSPNTEKPLLFSSPPTNGELDQLPPLLDDLCATAALFSQLQHRSSDDTLTAYIHALEEKSDQLEKQLRLNEQNEKDIATIRGKLADLENTASSLLEGIDISLATLGTEVSPSESAAAAIGRAAADAAARERALRAEVAAAEERVREMEAALQAASAEQQQVVADRDEKLRDADERLAETAAARRELSDSVAGALAALGTEVSPSEPAAAAIGRAAADAAARERALRAEVAAAEERVREMEAALQAASAEQQQVVADRDEKLRDADERLAETAAARRELSDSVAGALAALGTEVSPSEPAAAAIGRAAADAAARERALRAEVAAAEERVREMEAALQAASAEQQQVVADRDEKLRDADERLAETAAARRELSDSVAGALAALGTEVSPSEPAAAAIGRAAADAAARERALRAEVAAAEERVREMEAALQAASAEQQQVVADRDEKLRDADERLAETAAARRSCPTALPARLLRWGRRYRRRSLPQRRLGVRLPTPRRASVHCAQRWLPPRSACARWRRRCRRRAPSSSRWWRTATRSCATRTSGWRRRLPRGGSCPTALPARLLRWGRRYRRRSLPQRRLGVRLPTPRRASVHCAQRWLPPRSACARWRRRCRRRAPSSSRWWRTATRSCATRTSGWRRRLPRGGAVRQRCRRACCAGDGGVAVGACRSGDWACGCRRRGARACTARRGGCRRGARARDGGGAAGGERRAAAGGGGPRREAARRGRAAGGDGCRAAGAVRQRCRRACCAGDGGIAVGACRSGDWACGCRRRGARACTARRGGCRRGARARDGGGAAGGERRAAAGGGGPRREAARRGRAAGGDGCRAAGAVRQRCRRACCAGDGGVAVGACRSGDWACGCRRRGARACTARRGGCRRGARARDGGGAAGGERRAAAGGGGPRREAARRGRAAGGDGCRAAELSDSVAGALAALGTEVSPSEPAAAAIGRAAADAAARERALRAEVAAAEERVREMEAALQAASAEQQQVVADRDEKLRDADERLAETAAARRSCPTALPARLLRWGRRCRRRSLPQRRLGVRLPTPRRASVHCAQRWLPPRSACARWRRRCRRRAPSSSRWWRTATRSCATRTSGWRRRLPRGGAVRQRCRRACCAGDGGVAVGACRSGDWACGCRRRGARACTARRGGCRRGARARDGGGAAGGERRAAAGGGGPRREAARRGRAAGGDGCRAAELSDSVAGALAALGTEVSPSEPAAAAIGRAAADAAARERALRAEVAAAEERVREMEAALQAASAEQQQVVADRDEKLRDADERLAETAAARRSCPTALPARLLRWGRRYRRRSLPQRRLGVRLPTPRRASVHCAQRWLPPRSACARWRRRCRRRAPSSSRWWRTATRSCATRTSGWRRRLPRGGAVRQRCRRACCAGDGGVAVGACRSGDWACGCRRRGARACTARRGGCRRGARARDGGGAAGGERRAAAGGGGPRREAARRGRAAGGDGCRAAGAVRQRCRRACCAGDGGVAVGACRSGDWACGCRRRGARACTARRGGCRRGARARDGGGAAGGERRAAAGGGGPRREAARRGRAAGGDGCRAAELSDSVAGALAALGTEVSPSEPAAAAIGRAAADAAARERALRAEVAAAEERVREMEAALQAASAEQQQVVADRDEKLRDADERLAETAAARRSCPTALPARLLRWGRRYRRRSLPQRRLGVRLPTPRRASVHCAQRWLPPRSACARWRRRCRRRAPSSSRWWRTATRSCATRTSGWRRRLPRGGSCPTALPARLLRWGRRYRRRSLPQRRLGVRLPTPRRASVHCAQRWLPPRSACARWRRRCRRRAPSSSRWWRTATRSCATRTSGWRRRLPRGGAVRQRCRRACCAGDGGIAVGACRSGDWACGCRRRGARACTARRGGCRRGARARDGGGAAGGERRAAAGGGGPRREAARRGRAAGGDGCRAAGAVRQRCRRACCAGDGGVAVGACRSGDWACGCRRRGARACTARRGGCRRGARARDGGGAAGGERRAAAGGGGPRREAARRGRAAGGDGCRAAELSDSVAGALAALGTEVSPSEPAAAAIGRAAADAAARERALRAEVAAAEERVREMEAALQAASAEQQQVVADRDEKLRDADERLAETAAARRSCPTALPARLLRWGRRYRRRSLPQRRLGVRLPTPRRASVHCAQRWLPPRSACARWRRRCRRRAPSSSRWWRTATRSCATRTSGWRRRLPRGGSCPTALPARLLRWGRRCRRRSLPQRRLGVRLPTPRRASVHCAQRWLPPRSACARWRRRCRRRAPSSSRWWRTATRSCATRTSGWRRRLPRGGSCPTALPARLLRWGRRCRHRSLPQRRLGVRLPTPRRASVHCAQRWLPPRSACARWRRRCRRRAPSSSRWWRTATRSCATRTSGWRRRLPRGGSCPTALPARLLRWGRRYRRRSLPQRRLGVRLPTPRRASVHCAQRWLPPRSACARWRRRCRRRAPSSSRWWRTATRSCATRTSGWRRRLPRGGSCPTALPARLLRWERRCRHRSLPQRRLGVRLPTPRRASVHCAQRWLPPRSACARWRRRCRRRAPSSSRWWRTATRSCATRTSGWRRRLPRGGSCPTALPARLLRWGRRYRRRSLPQRRLGVRLPTPRRASVHCAQRWLPPRSACARWRRRCRRRAPSSSRWWRTATRSCATRTNLQRRNLIVRGWRFSAVLRVFVCRSRISQR
ncbi:hypothetical protein LSCM1_00557 [Leishmania martiniquensis]|uniref:Uncharacterized protein n=1 Tax=Leishmania martiniquensis TaxID=1580590 RepID=A0A836K612_9TRYP|nr:hypothetical protein LSCM1_00557 [Leishmania martiniquensis]